MEGGRVPSTIKANVARGERGVAQGEPKAAYGDSIKHAAYSKSVEKPGVLWSDLHISGILLVPCGEWMGGDHTYRQEDHVEG